ncbi:MAG: M1 family metallopeptidase [Anaerolineales bacterium]
MKIRPIAAIFVIILSTVLACNTVADLGWPTASATSTTQPSRTPVPEDPIATLGEPTPTFDPPPNPNPGAEGIGDPYFESLGNGGYEVQHYHLILDVDVELNEIAAVAAIDAVATQPLSSLNLEFIGLDIEGITVDGDEALFQRQRGELTIFLPEPAATGDALQITIRYHGTPGEGVSGAMPQYSEGWIYYGDGIMVAGEPTGASTWYPVNEHPADKATYSFAITVEDPYMAAANGILTEVADIGGRSTYHWEMDDPIAPYLVTVGIADFDVEEYIGPSGVPIRNYFGAGVTQAVRDDFALQGDMIAYFEDIFGPFPFDAYGVVVHDLELGFALETATMAVFGDAFTAEFVVAHELAHMWFGDAVGLKSWQDIWLNEGFASYAEELWNEHAYGREVMDEKIRGYYEYGAQFGQFFGDAPIGDPGPDNLFSKVVYVRGALTLHALRLEVGEVAFFDILQTYYGRYNGGNASTADFIAVAEEVSGQDLDAFFDGWLYQTELPDIPQMDLFAADFQ